jgi:hypothetical protein
VLLNVIARRKWHRNGTSGIAPITPSARAAAAIVMPPPWLPPVTTMRLPSTWGRVRAASTARTASVYTRR